MPEKPKHKPQRVIENRRARHDFHIDDTLEVGIVLVGTEVKAVRDGNASLAEGFVRVEGDPPTLKLHNVSIGEYGPAGPQQHKLARPRTLLAHRREIARLQRQVMQKGMTIVPLRLYFNDRGYAKLLIGIARGKATHDKRQAIKERESKRDLQRSMSRRM